MAVSKPSPNRKPSGYICPGRVIALVNLPRTRFMNPRLASCSSSSASSYVPPRISRNTFRMPSRMTRLMPAMTDRKRPETVGPIVPVTV